MVDNNKPRAFVKKIILRENLLPYVCAECQMGPEWNGKKLVLRLDHKNGTRNDDRLENLRFLCPNCDSQTDTFCGRNIKVNGVKGPGKKKRLCTVCTTTLTWFSKCRSCSAKERFSLSPQPNKIMWPPIEELRARLTTMTCVALAKELGISDNAIRKHLRNHSV